MISDLPTNTRMILILPFFGLYLKHNLNVVNLAGLPLSRQDVTSCKAIRAVSASSRVSLAD